MGRGIHHHLWVCTEQCVHTGKCVYMYICRCFVLQFHLLSLFSAHSVIDGERNAMFILIFDMYHNPDNQVPFYRQLDNLNTQPTIYSMSCTTNNQLLAPEGFVVIQESGHPDPPTEPPPSHGAPSLCRMLSRSSFTGLN